MQNILKKRFYNSFLFHLKVFFKDVCTKLNPVQNTNVQPFFKKFSGHFIILTALVVLSLASEVLPRLLKTKAEPPSLDALIPKGFVLLPIEIINGQDIIQLIGSHGVLDLYAYSDKSRLPEKQAASNLKVLPPEREEGRWTALVPEKQAAYFFEYPDPFYAVIQNPKKNNTKIYKKKERKSLIVIEENF